MRKIAILAALGGIAAVASATPMTFTGTGLGDSGIGVTFTDGSGTMSLGSIFAGQMKFNYGGNSITTLCVSLRNFIGGGDSWDTTTHNIGSGEGNLYVAAKVMTAGISSVTTNDQWAGLQLAVWKAIYDGSNTAGTNFKIDSGASASVLSFESSYYAAGVAASQANAKFYSLGPDGKGQPQMSAQAVPEPASMGVLALGAIGFLRRRRKA